MEKVVMRFMMIFFFFFGGVSVDKNDGERMNNCSDGDTDDRSEMEGMRKPEVTDRGRQHVPH